MTAMLNKKLLILIVVIFASLLGGYLICQNSQTVPLGLVEIQTEKRITRIKNKGNKKREWD